MTMSFAEVASSNGEPSEHAMNRQAVWADFSISPRKKHFTRGRRTSWLGNARWLVGLTFGIGDAILSIPAVNQERSA